MEVKFPNIPDISGKTVREDTQLKDILEAIKLTLEKLTGSDPNSNTALVDLLNDGQ